MSFDSFGLRPELLRAVADLGFEQPTPIQRDGIPPGLEGRDLLACAMTGSGKTAAFMLPILQRLLDNPGRGTRVLILAPTRELAAQIVENCNELAHYTKIKAAAVYGGVGMAPQERAFRNGTDIIVACPGRLLDHFTRPYARLDNLDVLVLDEADRMLDMGFLPDIRRILKQIPPVSQTLLFSATMPRPIAELSRQLLQQPVTLNIERRSAPATGVRQAIFPVRQDLKPALLLEMAERNEIDNALVFTRTKHRADRLTRFLAKHGVPCERVHGNRSQSQRNLALDGFKRGRFRILVATDVAARGIDIEALSHVINFDVPNMSEDYIHRVGRTARAGMTGEAFTFVSAEEKGDLRNIERKVGKTLPRRTLDGFDYNTPPAERFEIPIGERIAAIRARKAEDRARARAKAERKAQNQGQQRPAAPKRKPSRGPGGGEAGSGNPRAANSRTAAAAGGGGQETSEKTTRPPGRRPSRRRRRR